MHPTKQILKEKRFDAFLWDGIKRLEGEIKVFEKHLDFEFKDFSSSHIKLQIPFEGIEKIEDFKVFGIAKNGVKILSKDGKEDCFVLNQSDRLKNLLVKKPNNHSK